MAILSYKFEMFPSVEQAILIHKTFGCCRLVYNRCLILDDETYKSTGKGITAGACSKELTKWKTVDTFLKEVDATALQRAREHYFDARQNFFTKHTGKPRKKKKRYAQSYTSVNNHNTIAVLDNSIKLPKLGKVKCKVHQNISGRILTATISQTKSGRYFVSVNCTDVDIEPLAKTKQSIGIDMGERTYCAFSNGNKIDNPKFMKQALKKSKKLHKQLSRKKKNSKNHEKARITLAKAEERIANQRKDFQHKLSKQIVTDYDVICIENLNIKGMTDRKSPKAIRKNYNKSKSDRAYGYFKQMLEYKCKLYDKELIKVDTYYPSSQICSNCGYQNKEVKNLSVTEWYCPKCGAYHNRDINAAINILNEGLRIRTVT